MLHRKVQYILQLFCQSIFQTVTLVNCGEAA